MARCRLLIIFQANSLKFQQSYDTILEASICWGHSVSQTLALVILKFEQWLYHRIMCSKFVDGMSDSVETDQSDLGLCCLQRPVCPKKCLPYTIMILIIWTDKSGQTDEAQIRLLLLLKSDQVLHCLPFLLDFWTRTCNNCMVKLYLSNLRITVTVISSVPILTEPRHEKTCLRGF